MGVLVAMAPAQGFETGLYSTDEAAAKVAAHEMKGILSLFNWVTQSKHRQMDQAGRLSIPLACVVDWRGVRVFCETLLPIDSSTLRCGTCDAARTIVGLGNLPSEVAQAGSSLPI
jgi:Clustered mitochondria